MFADFFSSLMKYYTGGNDPNPRIFCFTATLHKTTSTAAAERFIKHSKPRGFWNYSLADQESQGTDNRDFTWQTRHSSFSQFLTFMILKCPIRWTSNDLIIELTQQTAKQWMLIAMIDWLGYLMTIKLRIWEQPPVASSELTTFRPIITITTSTSVSIQELASDWSPPPILASYWPRLGRDLDLELFDKLGSGPASRTLAILSPDYYSVSPCYFIASQIGPLPYLILDKVKFNSYSPGPYLELTEHILTH